MIIFVDTECIDYSWFFTAGYSVFKLVDMRSIATCFFRGLRYANVLLLSDRLCSVRARASELARRHVGIVTEPYATLQ